MSDCNDMMAGRVSQLPCGQQKVIHSEKRSSASSLKACKEWKACLGAERLHGWNAKTGSADSHICQTLCFVSDRLIEKLPATNLSILSGTKQTIKCANAVLCFRLVQ